MYPPRWRPYLAIRVITGRYLAHRTASIVSECATKSGATTVIDHCLLLRRALILYIILRYFMPFKIDRGQQGSIVMLMTWLFIFLRITLFVFSRLLR